MSTQASADVTAQTVLTELYRAHAGRLVRYATRITGHRADAEDAVQEAFMVAWNEYEQARPVNPAGWLTLIVRHRAQVAAQQRRRAVPAGDGIETTVDGDTAPDTNAGRCMADPDTALYVRAAVDLLPPRQRQVLRMWGIDGRPVTEIAGLLGITGPTVRAAVSRGLRTLTAA